MTDEKPAAAKLKRYAIWLGAAALSPRLRYLGSKLRRLVTRGLQLRLQLTDALEL